MDYIIGFRRFLPRLLTLGKILRLSCNRVKKNVEIVNGLNSFLGADEKMGLSSILLLSTT